eukprot:gene22208-34081_t
MGGERRPVVLVTGFNDWNHVESLWQCSENPSGRLLVGDAGSRSADAPKDGRLPALLREGRPDVEWRFLTLPVVWGIGAAVDYTAYDVVIHLGLQSALGPTLIQIEDGAYNLGVGLDAAGFQNSGPLDPLFPGDSLHNDTVTRVVRSLEDEQLPGGFKCFVVDPTRHNTYICNETNWRAVRKTNEGVVAAGYFLHIPQQGFDLALLAEALAALIPKLVDLSLPTPPAMWSRYA